MSAADTWFWGIVIGSYVLIFVLLALANDWRTTARKGEMKIGIFILFSFPVFLSAFVALFAHPIIFNWIFKEEVAAEKFAERAATIRVYADDPKGWLCREIGDSQEITVDGTLFIIDRKIGELERASTGEKDGRMLMIYGSAIGALKRERAEAGTFGMRRNSCAGVRNGRF